MRSAPCAWRSAAVGRRHPVTTRYVYVTDGPPVPDNAGPFGVPYQPLLATSIIRGDADVSQRHLVVDDAPAWTQVLDDLNVQTPATWGRDDHDATSAPGYARPFPVDFERETVVGIFTGTVTTRQDRVRIAAIKRGTNSIVVLYDVIRDRPVRGFFTFDHVWSPYLFVTLPKADLPVVVRRRQ